MTPHCHWAGALRAGGLESPEFLPYFQGTCKSVIVELPESEGLVQNAASFVRMREKEGCCSLGLDRNREEGKGFRGRVHRTRGWKRDGKRRSAEDAVKHLHPWPEF